MSGIAGCFGFDGAPVDRALLERMMGRLAHRGPDGTGLWTDGAVGLAHLAFHTTPESVRERQPLSDADGSLHLTLDGRVDNRAELLSDLRVKGFEPREDTDAELVLQSYRCWGEESPERIIGDFAFAIWDRRAEKLFCARDAIGMRQFYYFRDSHIFLFASEWRALFEHADVSRTPNEDFAAQYLCYTFTGNQDTPFRDVVRLPAGHSVTVTRAGLNLRRYWDVDLHRTIRYRTDDEYAEHFRTVFREAVRCRLRSHRPIAANLSGGLDSSSIVSMVEALRLEGTVPLPALEAYSLVFPGRPCDERPYIEAVARRWKLEPHYSEGAVLGRDFYESQVRDDFALAQSPNLSMHEPLNRLMVERGIRVELSGIGGDEWFRGGFYAFADQLRQGRLASFARLLREAMKQKELDFAPADLLRFGVWPLLPLSVRMAMRRVLGRECAPRIIGRALNRHIPSSAELCREPVLGQCTSFDQAEMYALLHGGDRVRAIEENDRRNARLGLESRWPFMDRRMVEFAFALPEEQRWRGGAIKHILRGAMRDLLPELVLNRTDKAEFGHILVDTLGAVRDRFDSDKSALVRAGWVRGEEVRRIYTENGGSYNGQTGQYDKVAWPMWSLFALETWMNEVVLQH